MKGRKWEKIMWCWFGIEAISVNFWFSVYIHRYRNACKCRGVCACSTHIHQFFSLKVSGSNTPIAMGTLSPHILSSNDHSPLEKFKALWEMANSRFRQGNYKMNLDHHLKENAQNIPFQYNSGWIKCSLFSIQFGRKEPQSEHLSCVSGERLLPGVSFNHWKICFILEMWFAFHENILDAIFIIFIWPVVFWLSVLSARVLPVLEHFEK